MNNRLIITSLLIFIFLPLFAQDRAEETLMTIHDRKISLGEFERIYRKNNSNSAIQQQSVEEYLELFINFKLKVIEAEEMGLDTLRSFLNEFNGYKKQLARPYMTDREEMEELVREAFERSRYDVNAAHILIRCDQNAPPADTALAWAKAFEIRQRILNGEDFGTVAKATSDDPSAKTNAGDLGYFTVFRMVYPFESGAYETDSGEVSMPVRTRFGYHIIKVLDKRPARGQVRVAHIMVLTPETMNQEQMDEAKNKIYRLYDSLQAGKDFHRLAENHSEDRGSAARGGELAWFGTGRMVPEFEKTAFGIKEPGTYSEPVKTSFGWHIIKLLEKKGIGDFESMKADLQDKVNKSDRAAYSRKAMIEKIKNRYQFTEYPGNLRPFYRSVDSSIFTSNWSAGRLSQMNEVLFTLDGLDYTQGQFAAYLENQQGGRPMDIEVLVNRKFEDFVESSVLSYEEDQLPEKYPEYRHLLQEYHDGILLFDLTDKMVWSKAIKDSTGLEAYFREHRDRYQWEERMDATIYTCRNEYVADFTRKFLDDKTGRGLSPEQIVEFVGSELKDTTSLSFTTGKFERGDNELVDAMDWDREISGNTEKDGKLHFVVNNRIHEPGPKSLDECRGLVTADYQNYLEKQWIKELRAKYTVKVNRELLSTIE